MAIHLGFTLFFFFLGLLCVIFPQEWARAFALEESNEMVPRLVGFGCMFGGALLLFFVAIGDGEDVLRPGRGRPSASVRLHAPAVFEGSEVSCIKGDCENGLGVIQIGSSSSYEGQFQDGYPHGHGVINFMDGGVYRGQLNRGVIEGQGRFDYNADEFYEGQFKEGRKFGTGRLKTSDGTEWAGEFANDRPSGFGVLTDNTGTPQRGQFIDGNFVPSL